MGPLELDEHVLKPVAVLVPFDQAHHPSTLAKKRATACLVGRAQGGVAELGMERALRSALLEAGVSRLAPFRRTADISASSASRSKWASIRAMSAPLSASWSVAGQDARDGYGDVFWKRDVRRLGTCLLGEGRELRVSREVENREGNVERERCNASVQ